MTQKKIVSAPKWAHLDLKQVPDMKTAVPGPKSKALHARCTKYFKGLSEQVKLFPVAFESGKGCELVDADGNRYIDFSSGIYVTTLGHCHPKVTEAVQQMAAKLMNCHDFTTEIKTRLVEKLVEILPGDLTGFQFYDSGTTAVEAGQRVLRAASKKTEWFRASMIITAKPTAVFRSAISAQVFMVPAEPRECIWFPAQTHTGLCLQSLMVHLIPINILSFSMSLSTKAQ
jgi:hypothetical protein